MRIVGNGLDIANTIIMDTTLGFREGISSSGGTGVSNSLSGNINILGSGSHQLILASSSASGTFTVSDQALVPGEAADVTFSNSARARGR